MSKIFAVFLALILPLQATSGLAAGLCASHVPQPHPGLHAHAQTAIQNVSIDQAHHDPSSSASSSFDKHHCGLCHISCSAMATGALVSFDASRSASGMPPEVVLVFISPPPIEVPERPQWLSLA
jgi:hypothetical protein